MAQVKQPKSRSKARPVGGASTKLADSKGRVVLGADFANRHVIVQPISKTELVIKMARVIPEDEAWLYANPAALNAVHEGLAQARDGKFAASPNLKADAKLLDELEDQD